MSSRLFGGPNSCTGFGDGRPSEAGCTGFDFQMPSRTRTDCWPSSQETNPPRSRPDELLHSSALERRSYPSDSEIEQNLRNYGGAVTVVRGVEASSGVVGDGFCRTSNKIATATISVAEDGSVVVEEGGNKRIVTGDEKTEWLRLAQDELNVRDALSRLCGHSQGEFDWFSSSGNGANNTGGPLGGEQTTSSGNGTPRSLSGRVW